MSCPIKYTCPNIDEVIEAFRHMQALLNDIEDNFELCDKMHELADDACAEMETIRTMNDGLRSWGYDLAYRLDETEKELVIVTRKWKEFVG